MKPGTDWEAVASRAESACGCNNGEPVPCRDMDENGCKPNATIDCKRAVQGINDVWIEGDIRYMTRACRIARKDIQMYADSCNI